MFRLMLVNISTLLLQFEKCIVIDICDTPPAVVRARSVASIPLAAVLFPLCDEFHAVSARGNSHPRASVIGRHALVPQPAARLSRVSPSRQVNSGGA